MVSAHVSLCIDADLGFDVSHAACPAPFPPSRIMGGRERVNNDRDRVVIGRVVVALAGGGSQRPAGANAVSAGGASPRFPPPVSPPPLSPHTGPGGVKAGLNGLQAGMQ